jgi:CRP-like cAMP-binding protein
MAREQSISQGASVIREGQIGNEVFLLEHGTVEVFRENNNGGQVIAELHAPAFFGERILLDPERVRTASVRSKTDLKLLVIRVDSFLALLRRLPSLRQRMRGLFVERT